MGLRVLLQFQAHLREARISISAWNNKPLEILTTLNVSNVIYRLDLPFLDANFKYPSFFKKNI